MVRAERVASAASARTLDARDLPEVAILGRSNVGKSSLINRLVGRRRLARTSRTPGRTRLIHLYRVERRGAAPLLLADLPGYGYARVAKTERRRWRTLVEGYLEGRAALRCAVLLQDLRRDASEDETELLSWLEARGVATLVALTKCDKLKPMRRAARVRALAAQLEMPRERVIATSAATGQGTAALWSAIDSLTAGFYRSD